MPIFSDRHTGVHSFLATLYVLDRHRCGNKMGTILLEKCTSKLKLPGTTIETCSL